MRRPEQLGPARQLTTSLLDDLNAAHRAAGAPTPLCAIRGRDLPVDGSAASTLTVPAELRTLWEWAPSRAGAHEFWPGIELLSAADSVAFDSEQRELAREVGIERPNTWISVFSCGQGDSLVVDTSRDSSTATPVIYQDLAGETGLVRDAAPSLGELVAYWTEQIRSRRVVYDGRWHAAAVDPPRDFPLWPAT